MGEFDQHHGRFLGYRTSWRQASQTVRRRWLGVARGVVGGMALSLGLGWGGAMQAAQNPVIQVGIVQRFGEELQDRLVIEALPGEQLTLRFDTNGQAQTVTTTRVVLGLTPTPLAEATLQERVVLSNHRSFESAEYSAHEWRQLGIEPEIAQPGGWEVWANREAYDSPLVRRLLVQNLKENGGDRKSVV